MTIDMHIFYLLAEYVRIVAKFLKEKPKRIIEIEKILRDVGFKFDDTP